MNCDFWKVNNSKREKQSRYLNTIKNWHFTTPKPTETDLVPANYRNNGIDTRNAQFPLKPTLAGLISRFHIRIFTPDKLPPERLLTRLLR